MNKKFMAVALLLAACFMVFAGGAPEAKSDKVVLTVWESLQGPDEFIKQAGAAFTAKYPNIEINFVNVESNDAANQIALDGPAGVGADLFAAQHDQIGKLVSQGLVNPVANPDAIKGSLLGACIQGATYQGTMYGYPVSAETYALFYNKDLVSEDEIPSTWEGLAEWSAEFSKKNPGKYGFVMDVGNAYYSIIFASANGNRLFGESGEDFSQSYVNTDAAVKGMTAYQNIRKIGLDVPAGDLTGGICDAAFTSGNAAMIVTGPWNLGPYKTAGVNYGVIPLPSLPGDTTPSPSFSGIRCMFVSAFSDHPAEAALFAEFLLSDEMQQLRYELTNGALPSISTELDNEFALAFLDQLDYAYPMRTGPQMDKYWEVFGAASSNIWNGADVKAELDAANASIIAK